MRELLMEVAIAASDRTISLKEIEIRLSRIKVSEVLKDEAFQVLFKLRSCS